MLNGNYTFRWGFREINPAPPLPPPTVHPSLILLLTEKEKVKETEKKKRGLAGGGRINTSRPVEKQKLKKKKNLTLKDRENPALDGV
jgi:hypothetical protein